MKPSQRKKSQRGIRRSDAPCSESNSQRTADAGAQSMNVGNYTQREVSAFLWGYEVNGGTKDGGGSLWCGIRGVLWISCEG